MASTVTITASSAGTVNLQSTSVNPDAAPVSTPRQGGFTLRNRWNCSNLAAASKATFETSDWSSTSSGGDASLAATHLRMLEVPKRTAVKDVTIYAVPGETQPDHQCTFSGSAGSSVAMSHDINLVGLGVYAEAYKSASQASLASLVELGLLNCEDPDDASSDTHGTWLGSYLTTSWSALSVPTNAGITVRKNLASSTNVVDAGTFPHELATMPYGGFITLRVHSSVSADSVNASVAKFAGAMTGVWEVQANCNYIPE